MAEKLFAPGNRAKILARAVGKPTGVTVEVGGLTFNLVALSTDEVLSVTDLLTKVANLASKSEGGTVTGTDIMRALGEDGSKVARLFESILRRSGQVNGPDEERLFTEWFGSLSIFEAARTLVPKILEANGLGAMLARPTEPATSPPEKASP